MTTLISKRFRRKNLKDHALRQSLCQFKSSLLGAASSESVAESAMIGHMLKKRPHEMSLLERRNWQEQLRLKLMSKLRASQHPKCGEHGGAESQQMPIMADGRSFCCAIKDILAGSENAIRWGEMDQIADWAGVRMRYLREAHEGYLRWAIMKLPYERANLPESFRPFPEDPSMVETPEVTMQFVRNQKEKMLDYLCFTTTQ